MEEQQKVPYILAIGDIISSSYIKMDEDYADVSEDEKGYKRLSIELGSKLPYEQVDIIEAVECSPNAAVSMSRLGLDVGLMSWIGDDLTGSGMKDYLISQNVNIDNFVVEPGVKTNYHFVLRYGADRTKLQKFEDYKYEWIEPQRKPDWIYLGVLGEKSWPLHESILQYLHDNPDIKLAFQPGMHHFMWGTEQMLPFYKRADIVVMNREEAAEVTSKDRGDVSALIDSLHDMGVGVAVVTDGPEGAYASEGDGIKFMPIYPDIEEPYDRTGAGDAFASTITAALATGMGLTEALRWAPINSMHVSQYLGAQKGLLSRDQIMEYLDKAPEDYRISDYK